MALIPVVLIGIVMSSFMTRHTVPRPNLSAAQVASSQCKIAVLTGGTPCGPQGAGSGPAGPQHITVVLSDSDLTVLANQRAVAKGLPVDNIIVHALGNNMIEGTGDGHAGGQTVSFYFQARIDSPNHDPKVAVTSMQVPGVPGVLTDQLVSGVGQSLDVGGELNLSQVQVSVGVGQLTVSGWR